MTDQSIMNEFAKQSMEIIRLKDEKLEMWRALESAARSLRWIEEGCQFSKRDAAVLTQIRGVLERIK